MAKLDLSKVDPQLLSAESVDLQQFSACMQSYREYNEYTRKEAAVQLQVKATDIKKIERADGFPFVGEQLQRVWRSVKDYRPLDEG